MHDLKNWKSFNLYKYRLSELAFYLFLLLSIHLLFNLLLVNSFFPITEGWFQDYINNINSGLVEYRDFYTATPPGYLWLLSCLNKLFGNTFIYYRIFGIIERLILFTIIFILLNRLYSPKISFIALSTAGFIYISNIQDIFYSYYQTSFTCAIIALFFLIQLYEKPHKFIKYSILFGLFAGFSFLMKQNIGAIFPTVIGIAYIFLSSKRWQALKNIFISFLTAMCVLGIAAIYLYKQEALIPCISAIFSGASSKGNFTTIFFGFIPRIINFNSIVLFFSILVIFFLNWLYFKSQKHKMLLFSLIVFQYIGFLYLIFSRLIIPINLLGTARQLGKFTSLIFLIFYILGIIQFWNFGENRFSGIVFFLFTIYIIQYFSMHQNTTIEFMKLRDYRQILIYSLFFFILSYTIIRIYTFIKHPTSNIAIHILLLTAAEIFMFIHGMSYIIEDHGTLLAFAIIIAEVFSAKTTLNRIKNILVFSLCMLMVLTIVIQRNNFTYNWWGVGTIADTYRATYSYKDPNLARINGSKESTIAMNQIYDVINAHKADSDTLYSFPHINYFNVMSGLLSPTYSKVHYFDVCPDNIARSDAKLLRANPPDFVIWMELPDSTWGVHEIIFRNGNPSGQRELQTWFQTHVQQSDSYIHLGTYTIENSDPIFLYKLNK